jgi:hypothetical protein
MVDVSKSNPALMNRMIDFLVLELTFYLSCLLLSVGGAIRQIICNATAILVATFIMMVVENVLSANGGVYVVLLFSSVMAFFVLGSLLPLVHKNPAPV